MAKRKIKCIITGSSYTFGKDYYQKKVDEYKSEESLQKYFITRKAKSYLSRGYSVNEVRSIIGVDDSDLPADDSQDVRDILEYHSSNFNSKNTKSSKNLNFSTHKSDIEVSDFINTIRQYEN
mgnify:CR=1 FL=1|tara:strand:- start:702 stop:1067 length:366 start_codon:yes stop_codon:yes gene_type:complete